MDALAHYREGFLLRRAVLAAVLAGVWGLVLSDMLWPGRTLMDRLAPLGVLLPVMGWLWTNLLIIWAGVVKRRPLLWVEDGQLVFVHRRQMRMPLSQVRRVRLTLAGDQSQLEVEGEKRLLKIGCSWAQEDLEDVAARVRAATGVREWVAAEPVVHSAAPTAVG